MCEITPEVWRPVPGWEHYSVSTRGHVMSQKQMIKPWKFSAGYLQLRLSRDGKRTTFSVHHLVLLAFVGPRPNGMETRHLDSNPAHNCLHNLRYGTRSENVMDEVVRGTHHRARATHCPHGHPYAGDNLYINPNRTDRRCMECARIRDRARYRARKATER